MTVGMITSQIKKLLLERNSSRQVIDLGYAPGSVYKVQRQIRRDQNSNGPKTVTKEHIAPPAIGRNSGASGTSGDLEREAQYADLDADPEIAALKKQIRKAQLERELAEMRAPIDLEARLAAVERKVREQEATIGDIIECVTGDV